MRTMKRIGILFLLLVLIFFCTPAYADNYYDYSTVYTVQTALNMAGYFCGEPDGDIGTNTRGAISSFRTDHHLGDNTEIDDVLLYALGLSDKPVWYDFFNQDDQFRAEDMYLMGNACVNAIKKGFSGIGANLGAYLGLGNYLQIDDDSYSFALMCNADENEEIMATVRVDGDQCTLESVRSYLTGDYFYNESGDTVPYSKTGFSHASVDSRAVRSTPEPTPAPTQAGADYVLNKNTHKFHYPWCSSASDIKPKNRWDYTGTREEIINMGYQPCKRCNP